MPSAIRYEPLQQSATFARAPQDDASVDGLSGWVARRREGRADSARELDLGAFAATPAPHRAFERFIDASLPARAGLLVVSQHVSRQAQRYKLFRRRDLRAA